jgi:BirA family biotin operon repressor/biotin-[acetyl-CoA-carboxylase] ligase
LTHPPFDVDALARLLRRRRLGDRVAYFESVESTNDRALEMGDAGHPEGLLVLSEEQVRGRGRRGRAWSSPPRRGIYASLLLRPRLEAPRLPRVGFAAAVGIARSLTGATGRRVEIKWPNDLVLSGGKLGGILSESRGSEPFLVVGLGVNVNQDRQDFPPEIRREATSLRLAAGRFWDRTTLLAQILEGFEAEYLHLLELAGDYPLARWEEYSSLQDGAAVTVSLDGESLRGVYRGVTGDGEMCLETAPHAVRRIAYGDVRRVRSEA